MLRLEMDMAALTVRKLDPGLVHRLRRRAAEQGVSAEELHRRILERALDEPGSGAAIGRALRRMGKLGFVLERALQDDEGRPPVEF
jgi:plasmid stability protein